MSSEDLKIRNEGEGYILVDLDRTLAFYDGWEKQQGEIGPPIPAMVERVQRWLHAGRDVRIFTARASKTGNELTVELDKIDGWCTAQFGHPLPVQNYKDFRCVAIWDDLAVSVEPNTGFRLTSEADEARDPLEPEEEWELMGYPEGTDTLESVS